MKFQEIAEQVKKEVEEEIGASIEIIKYSSSPWSGRAYIRVKSNGVWKDLNQLKVPYPKSNISLSTYLHEVGHLTKLAREQKKSCLREFYAEKFCLDQLKRFGIKRSSKMIKNSNWYMAYSLAQAMNRKLKHIPEEMKKYKKFLRKVTRTPYIYHFVNGKQLGEVITETKYYAK